MLNCLKKKQKRTKNPLFLCKLIKKWKFFLQYSTIYGNIIMYTGDVLGKKELKMKEEIRKTQLKNNVESILYGYENGMLDDPENYPQLPKEEVIAYVYEELFDIKDDGQGSTLMHKGICDDLKFLGTEVICDEILRVAEELEILA